MPKKPISATAVLTMMDKLHREAQSPSIPPNYIVGTKFADFSANDVERAIERFASIVGFLAERTKTQGRKMSAVHKETPMGRVQVSKEKFVTSTGRKGSSDMKVVLDGRFVAVEIKFGKDTQKVDQKKYQADVEKSGGMYIIVKCFEDFLIWYVARYGRPEIMQKAIDRLKQK